MFILRFLLSFFLTLGIAAILWTQTGPFAWVGGLQVAVMGRYSTFLTLMLTVLICLAPLFLILSFTPKYKTIEVPQSPGRTGLSRSVSCGGLLATAVILAFGLAPLFAPSPPIPEGELADTVAQATWIPAQAKMSRAKEQANIDLEKQVSVGLRNSIPTLYTPIRQTGSSEVIGLVAGSEIDWQNASISAAPFPNPANDAALAQSSDAVLTLKPVPFFVRRQLASQNLPVPMFLPTFQWGRHPLSANLPLIIGGAFALISFLIALLQTRKRESFVGRPSDL
ncbi:MAG: hypothetical protein V4640_16055 [Verrucomicrobiota bacterium]